ncbi:hypothetical protein FS842_003702 [Serendipita sp. 407]|nr:hypothetical protein FS842_003702 [Serendipita sp. 407]
MSQETENNAVVVQQQTAVTNDVAASNVQMMLDPVPMSFPAMLLNPRQRAPQLARIRETDSLRGSRSMTTTIDGKTRGKRRIRRFDNLTFYGNPHIVTPVRADYQLGHSHPSETFPKPLPNYLPRVSPAPSGAVLRRSDPSNINSAYAGRFTLGLRGVRKELRQKGGGRARRLVEETERAIRAWLDGEDETETSLAPEDTRKVTTVDSTDPPLITVVSSAPLELVWNTDDAFARWIIHCVSRWHNVVSFSKDVQVQNSAGETMIQRQTHLLRPNSRHPDPRSTAAIYTPTATDFESSIFDTEGSDYGGLVDSVSSLQIVDPSEVVAASAALASGKIDEEEEEMSDAESSFSIIDHPTAESTAQLAEEQRTAAAAVGAALQDGQNGEDASRPLRATERTSEIYVHQSNGNMARMHVRSESSPSRSPIRPRRFRHPRRLVTTSSRCAVFQVEPPSTFMAYVYGQ